MIFFTIITFFYINIFTRLMPLKEVEVAECFVEGGEAERDKEARESAAEFEANLVWRVEM